MLVAYRLAGLSALETYYAGVRARTQSSFDGSADSVAVLSVKLFHFTLCSA